MLPTDAEQQKVQDKFMRARETSQRVMADINAQDSRQTRDILDMISEFAQKIKRSSQILTDKSSQITEYGVPFPGKAIEDTATYLQSFLYFGHIIPNKLTPYETYSNQIPRLTKDISAFGGALSEHFFDSAEIGPLSLWENCTVNISPTNPQCDEHKDGSAMNYKLEVAKYILNLDMDALQETAAKWLGAYKQALNTLFEKSTYNYSSNENHIECTRLLQSDFDEYKTFTNITDELKLYVKTSSISSKLEIARRIKYVWDRQPKNHVIGPCTWFNFIQVISTTIVNDVTMAVVNVAQDIPTLRSYLESIGAAAKSLIIKLEEFSETEAALQAFLVSNTTKAELAEVMSRSMVVQIKTDIRQLYTEISTSFKNVLKMLNTMSVNLESFTKVLFSFDPPIADSTLLKNLPIYQFAETAVTNKHIKDLFDHISTDQQKYFSAVTQEIFKVFSNYTKDAIAPLETFSGNFVSASQKLMKNLDRYANGNAMDHAFFM